MSPRWPDALGVAAAPVAAGCLLACAGACAQTAQTGTSAVRPVSVVPRVSLTETWTDNVRLSEVRPQADQITEISPGLRVTVTAPRVAAYLDYALNEVRYAQDAAPRRTRQALNSLGTLEAVRDGAYVDFSGTITQEVISLFGPPLSGTAAINPNQTEVSRYRISPYLRGTFGDELQYELRYSRADTHTDTDTDLQPADDARDAARASGLSVVDGLLRLRSDRAWDRLGWSAEVSRQQVDYRAGRATEADRLNLGLSYAITPALRVLANAGREANNFTRLEKQRDATYSLGVDWWPSPRTQGSAVRGERLWGHTHAFRLAHRTPRTAWRWTDVRDVATTSGPSVNVGLGSVYDLLFDQFASLEPDPGARAQRVNAYLQDNGLRPDAQVISPFLSSAVFLQRRQDLLLTLLGARDSITLAASRSESRRLDTLSAGVDDLSASSRIRQSGLSLHLTHRLSPHYALGALLVRQTTSGDTLQQDATLRLLQIKLTGRLGRHTTTSLAWRRALAGGLSPYRENALLLSLMVQL